MSGGPEGSGSSEPQRARDLEPGRQGTHWERLVHKVRPGFQEHHLQVMEVDPVRLLLVAEARWSAGAPR